MSTRGDLTRRKILESARILFAEKGYTAVTMEDVRLCCGLSRGGLYRHYSSTQEIFTQLIEDEQKAAFAALAKAIQDKIPAAQMLETFLKNRIKHLFNPQTCLENAINAFAANAPQGSTLIVKRAEDSINILTQILWQGCQQQVFFCKNCRSAALHILCLLEGMAKHNALIPMSAEETNQQLLYLQSILQPQDA